MTEEILGWDEIEASASFIRDRTGCRPSAMIITGSGLGALAHEIEAPASLRYTEIPDFSPTGVLGHPGELITGELAGREVALMQGRVHFYEGHSLQRATFPVRVLHRLGAQTLIVTNAAGGLNDGFETGDLMLITDHINLVGMAGFNPLRGPNDERLGPRFVDMSSAYDVGLRDLALSVAQELGIELRQGTYVMSAGPTFETPADVRFLRLIGADAVGMSTVPEVIVARHEGMRVLGLSHISNVIPSVDAPRREELAEEEGLHQGVLDAGSRVVPKLSLLIR
ncbi:MAG: purine-nucleoside phosphorylase, partial [Anaerolineae bacterium]|nr:purine-nucleoside phosphorylase [Anaerolineae bacterium]